MSIKVTDITKIYGQQKALDSVSLQIEQGEIVGLLGPNGAGKSTLMKILSCYIPSNSGKAEVCGFDCNSENLEVRSRLGYLPESNPLYHDMYVVEYLKFVGKIHNIKNLSSRITEIIELTGLKKEMHKKIGALSKGYRQRVGLAQAFIHDPEVLILDEPTSGLDPNQLVEIRSLIKKIGQSKTVLFSSHILQEVEAVCDRVVIINNGKIIADGKTSEINQLIQGEESILVSFKEAVHLKALTKIEGVLRVVETGSGSYKIAATKSRNITEEIYKFSKANNLTLTQLTKEESRLEDVFQKLTSKKGD